MKKLVFILFFFISLNQILAQSMDENVQLPDTTKTYLVVKNDGSEYVGKLLKNDEREVLIETQTIGRLFIPKYEIKKIEEISEKDVSKRGYYGAETYSTRYFITTNGLSIDKGDNYVLMNLYGPDIQFAVKNNFTLGGMTTWMGIPIIGSVKKSFNLSDKTSVALGVLAGTASWVKYNAGGMLAYGAFTLGDRKANLTLSGGWVGVNSGDGNTYSTALLSVATMIKISEKITFVGDSFIVVGDHSGALIIPGLRFSRGTNKAFQFGLAALAVNGSLMPAPIPMLSWFVKL